MPPKMQIKKVSIVPGALGPVDEPDFVTKQSMSTGPRLTLSNIHPTAMTTNFEPADEEGDEPEYSAPSSSKKKKSSKGVLIAGAAVVGFLALKGK